MQTDRAAIQSSPPGFVGEFGSEFAVDEEPEVISASDDADVVPLVWADVCDSERRADAAGMRLSVFVDDQPCSARAGVFRALGEMEIPRAENVRTNADVTKVGVIAFERPLAGRVGSTADFHAKN